VKRLAQKAAQLPSAQNNFLTKRLNVWVSSHSAWLNMQALEKCADQNLDLDDFAGETCVIGMDLATTKDICALAIVFRKGEDYFAFGRYYIPEETIENSGNSQYSGWEKTGKLIATPGASTDFAAIEADVLALAAKFKVRILAKDPYQSHFIGTRIAEAGLEVRDVSKSNKLVYSPATKALESLILDRKFHYDGDPVMTWMFSNVVCRTDARENVIPDKDRPENKIDVVDAIVMGLVQLLPGELEPVEESIYEHQGIKYL
jgi:phage terminase large subunit-like protein